MFLQSAMLFAEMSYLTDERCFGEAQGIMLLLQALTGMGAGISQPSGELPLFPTWWVLHGCWWYLHMRASPFSRAMGEFRKGVAIALLWLSFLSLGWERGETKLSLSPPCATVPIGFQSSWVINIEVFCWKQWQNSGLAPKRSDVICGIFLPQWSCRSPRHPMVGVLLLLCLLSPGKSGSFK